MQSVRAGICHAQQLSSIRAKKICRHLVVCPYTDIMKQSLRRFVRSGKLVRRKKKHNAKPKTNASARLLRLPHRTAILKVPTGHLHRLTPDQDLYSFLPLDTNIRTQRRHLANSLCPSTEAVTCIQAINLILHMANPPKTCTVNVSRSSVQWENIAIKRNEC